MNEQDAYERWCERQDLDPSENHWDAFDADMADAAADHAEAMAEARADARGDR